MTPLRPLRSMSFVSGPRSNSAAASSIRYAAISDDHFLCFGMLGIKGSDTSIFEDQIGYKFHECWKTSVLGRASRADLGGKGAAGQNRWYRERRLY